MELHQLEASRNDKTCFTGFIKKPKHTLPLLFRRLSVTGINVDFTGRIVGVSMYTVQTKHS